MSTQVAPGDALPVVEDAEPLSVAAGEATLGGYAWWQDGAAPAVVLLHGWAQDASYHAARARRFHADGWHAVSVASRGWPGSGGDPDDYGLSAETDLGAIVAAVQQRDASELWVIAYSAGGLIAARGLPAVGDAVWGLVTVNAPMNVRTEYRDTPSQLMRDYYDQILTERHWQTCSPVTVADRIHTPMLVVTGTDDRLIPPSQAAEICDLVPSASYLEIEQMRHLPTEDEWRTILLRAGEWMSGIRSTR